MIRKFEFLMCPPTYFDCTYDINPWMTDNINKVDVVKAMDQWIALKAIIERYAAVTLAIPDPKLPDMAFTANAGAFWNDVAVVSDFKCVERKPETEKWAFQFRALGIPWTQIRQPVPDPDFAFEGAGDCLTDHRGRTWIGYGFRTTAHGVLNLVASSRYTPPPSVTAVQLVDPRFYHLDTCFCPLSTGHAIWYPAAFSADSQAAIQAAYCRGEAAGLITLTEIEALTFAANAVEIVNGTVVMGNTTDSVVEKVTAAGIKVIQTELSEFLKAGGSAKCLTLRIPVTVRA